MDTALHCTNYDEQLQAASPHFVNYPNLLPFLGSAWPGKSSKILFIGESHYLPKDSKIKNDSINWYAGSSVGFTNRELGHTYTRGVIADMESGRFDKAYTIFYNLKRAVANVHTNYNAKHVLFHNFGYYNYFQRPAEINGGSIKNSFMDNEIAFVTLKTIIAITEPSAVIFVSKKAANSFWGLKGKDKETKFPSIYQLPHPACAWWHKPHKERRDSTLKTSGKQRFINIINKIDLQINDIVIK